MPVMKSAMQKLGLLVVFLSLASIGVAQDAPSIWDGIFSAEQANRGEAVYTEACIACHGQDLGGNSNAPGLVGMGFMFLWEGRTVGEFFEKIRSEMPTDRPGQLSIQSYLDVVSYILRKNAFPAGDAILPSDAAILDAITIASE